MNININTPLQYQFQLNEKYFKPAAHYRKAVEFCKKRKIEDHIDKFYYNIHPKSALSDMIIFPFTMEDKITLYGLQGRHPEYKRFMTFSKNESLSAE